MNLAATERPHPVFREISRGVWQQANATPLSALRRVPEETPIAFSYQGASYAVMMASPSDLGDFAVGFSLNEGVICSPSEIEELEVIRTDDGILLRMALANGPADAFWKRRRYLPGPSGCGLCGVESRAQAARRPTAGKGRYLRIRGRNPRRDENASDAANDESTDGRSARCRLLDA